MLTGKVRQVPQVGNVGDLQAGRRSGKDTKPKHTAETDFLTQTDKRHTAKCKRRVNGQVKVE